MIIITTREYPRTCPIVTRGSQLLNLDSRKLDLRKRILSCPFGATVSGWNSSALPWQCTPLLHFFASNCQQMSHSHLHTVPQCLARVNGMLTLDSKKLHICGVIFCIHKRRLKRAHQREQLAGDSQIAAQNQLAVETGETGMGS